MVFKSVASINGILSIAYGVAGLVVPAAIASVYGLEITDRERGILRLLGASYLGLGVLCWVARGVIDGAARRAIALGALAGWGLGVPVELGGLVNALGWSVVGLQIAFVLGWGWALREAARSRSRVTA